MSAERSNARPVSWLVLAGVLLLAHGAWAQDGVVPPPGERPPEPATSPSAPPDAATEPAPPADTLTDRHVVEDAAALYRAAEARYGDGDVAGALALMRESYRLSGKPELLFNLGQLERELRQCSDALRDYQAYLAQVKDGAHRQQAAGFARELAAQCPPVPVTPPLAVAPPPAPAPHYWTPLKIAGWATLSAAVMTGAAATYFAFSASSDARAVEAHIKAGTWTAADTDLMSDGSRSATWGQALGGVTFGLAAVGITLLMVHDGEATHADTGLSVRCSPGGANAVYRAAF